MHSIILLFLDLFFNLLHLTIIGFNLFGWIPQRTRFLHRWCVGVTAFCWLAVGWIVGTIGYCPITDWHWRVKHLRGQHNLPSSYIAYLLDLAHLHPSPAMVDRSVAITFTVIVAITLWLWQVEKRR